MAGLDVYAGAYSTPSQAFEERFSTPASPLELVAKGKAGTKSALGGYTDLTDSEQRQLIERRDEWYTALGNLTKSQPPRSES